MIDRFFSITMVDLNAVDLSVDQTVTFSTIGTGELSLNLVGGAFESSIAAAQSVVAALSQESGPGKGWHSIRAVEGVILFTYFSYFNTPVEVLGVPELPVEAVTLEAPVEISKKLPFLLSDQVHPAQLLGPSPTIVL